MGSQGKSRRALPPGLAGSGLQDQFAPHQRRPSSSTAFCWFSTSEQWFFIVHLPCALESSFLTPHPIEFCKGSILINVNEHFAKILFPRIARVTVGLLQAWFLHLSETYVTEVAALY